MKRLAVISVMVLAAFASACHRRPLVDPQMTHYVRIYIDEELKNITTGFYNPDHAHPAYRSPEIMRVVLYDASGRIASERYLRNRSSDEQGVYYDGYIVAAPGDYTLLAYNFGTEATIVRSEADLTSAEAYTNEIASHLRSRLSSRSSESHEQIVYDADPLFVAQGGVHVAYGEEIDELRTLDGEWFKARSIVEAYYIQIKIRNIRYVSSTVALLTGMAGSVRLADGSVDADNDVTIYFEMQQSDIVEDNDTAVIYSTFGTFGKLPDEANELELSFDVLTTYGSKVTADIDITDKFSEPDATEHGWIIIDSTMEIPEPPASSGGFTPGVTEWGDIHTDIVI